MHVGFDIKSVRYGRRYKYVMDLVFWWDKSLHNLLFLPQCGIKSSGRRWTTIFGELASKTTGIFCNKLVEFVGELEINLQNDLYVMM